MAIDATTGGANANSYLTEAALRAYAVGTPAFARAASWTSAQIEAGLRTATRFLDGLPWLGEESAPATQRLAWPRRNVPDPDRLLYYIPDTVLPTRLLDACAELAIFVIDAGAEDPLGALPAQTIVREKVGPIETEWAGASNGAATTRTGLARVPHVRARIAPMLRDGAGQARTIRS